MRKPANAKPVDAHDNEDAEPHYASTDDRGKAPRDVRPELFEKAARMALQSGDVMQAIDFLYDNGVTEAGGRLAFMPEAAILEAQAYNYMAAMGLQTLIAAIKTDIVLNIDRRYDLKSRVGLLTWIKEQVDNARGDTDCLYLIAKEKTTS